MTSDLDTRKTPPTPPSHLDFLQTWRYDSHHRHHHHHRILQPYSIIPLNSPRCTCARELEPRTVPGMPESILAGNASYQLPDSRTMTTTAQYASVARTQRTPPICPTDEETILPDKDKMTVPTRKVNKKSPEYILKTGLAGGIAGCAVSSTFSYAHKTKYTNLSF